MGIPLKAVVIALTVLGVAACAPRQLVREEPPPCTDPLYLRLKTEAPDSLSEREWIRLQDLERSCTTARSAMEHREAGGIMGMRRMSWWVMTAMMVGGAAMWLMMGSWR